MQPPGWLSPSSILQPQSPNFSELPHTGLVEHCPGVSKPPSMLCKSKGCESQVLHKFGHTPNGFGLISEFLLILGARQPRLGVCPWELGGHTQACTVLVSPELKPRGQSVLEPTREHENTSCTLYLLLRAPAPGQVAGLRLTA